MKNKRSKTQSTAGRGPKRERIILIIILLLAFSLRLAFFLQLSSSSIADMVIEDSKTYHDWAAGIGGGRWISDEVFYALPLYPYFLGIIYTVFGVSLTAARFLQILMGTVNCFLIYLLGKRIFNDFTGLVAALAMSVYGWLIVYDASILSPVLIIFLIASFLLLLIRLDAAKAGPAKWLGGGLLAGITAAASAHILLFILLVPLWKHLSAKWKGSRSGWFSSLTFLAGAIIALSPITIHNWTAGNDFVPLTAHGGINFFIGNNPHARGVFEPPPILRSGGKTLRRDAEKLAEKDRGRNLKPSEISAYWFEKGFTFIRQNPLDYLVLLGKKFTIFWDNLEIADVIHPSFFKEFTPILKIHFLTFGMIAPFSLIGLVVAWGRRKRISILYFLVGTYVLSTILYFVNSRYRLSLVPFLLLFASYFICWCWESLKMKRWPAFSAALVGLVFFAVWVNPELIGKDARFTLNMGAGYNHLGSYYSQQGQLDKALIQFEKALRLEPYRPEAHYNLANIYYRMGELERALRGYREAVRRNPFYDSAHLAIALVYEKMGENRRSGQ